MDSLNFYPPCVLFMSSVSLLAFPACSSLGFRSRCPNRFDFPMNIQRLESLLYSSEKDPDDVVIRQKKKQRKLLRGQRILRILTANKPWKPPQHRTSPKSIAGKFDDPRLSLKSQHPFHSLDFGARWRRGSGRSRAMLRAAKVQCFLLFLKILFGEPPHCCCCCTLLLKIASGNNKKKME